MDLFNIGPIELIFLLVLAVIILGPQRAAEVAGQIGRMLASFRRNVNAVRAELSQSLEEETKALREVQNSLQKQGEQLQDSLRKLDQEAAGPPPPDPSHPAVSINGKDQASAASSPAPEPPEEKRP